MKKRRQLARLVLGFVVGLGFYSGCTGRESSSSSGEVAGDCPPGMVLIEAATATLGESDPVLLERFEGGRVLPESSYRIAPYCIDLHAFPGRSKLPWPVDGIAASQAQSVEAALIAHGRRLCTVVELTYAAAGAENRRFPWSADQRNKPECEDDDERPTSLGSRPECVSPFGLMDLQVRSSWARMTPEVRSTLGAHAAAKEGAQHGAAGPYWLWGATARDDTYYAPTNFGLHHHEADGQAFLDDALRVCATPGAVSPSQEERWQALVDRYPESASFRLLLD